MKAVFDNIGLTIQELLTIILPGLLLCYFLSRLPLVANFQGVLVLEGTDWVNTIGILGFSYFFGYVAYVIGSYLDGVYDKLKLWILRKEAKNVSVLDDTTLYYINPKYKWIFFRFWYFRDTHNLIVKVGKLKDKYKYLRFEYLTSEAILADEKLKLMDKKMYNHMDAYQYAFRRLMLEENPLMFEEVIRYYATAKFFRSMTVVLFIGGSLWTITSLFIIYIPWIFLLTGLSFLLFLNRWRKANHVAYKNLIVVCSEKENGIDKSK